MWAFMEVRNHLYKDRHKLMHPPPRAFGILTNFMEGPQILQGVYFQYHNW